MSTRKSLQFTVDSALLEELGERLVGKPYIAVAELVKNSYDADATEVEIKLFPEENFLEVNDNGHGMTEDEFIRLWMNIGSTHKTGQLSKNFSRRMTGSKGVGRLAVQYLAFEFQMSTVSEIDNTRKLLVTIKWKEAINESGYLTDVTVYYDIIEDDAGFPVGTKIRLNNLKHEWTARQIRNLAKEIWWLRSPFRSKLYTENIQGKKFDIDFISSEKEYEEVFNWQIRAIMEIWYARIVGENEQGKITISLEYPDEDPIIFHYEIEECAVQNGDWELRVYYLQQRQLYGISVGTAREYLRDFGGVYVYDSGFQLPYYGDPKNDWLKLQYDFSQRLTASELLPETMSEKGAMQFLPTLSRILGIVNISTANETNLDILITRDRLNENTKAFENLVEMVRVSIDYYAYNERKRRIEKALKKTPIEKPKPKKIIEVVELYKDSIEPIKYEEFKESIVNVAEEFQSEAEATAEQVSIIGPLATIGISTLAIEHEIKWQTKTLDLIINQIEDITYSEDRNELRKKINTIKRDLKEWSTRVKNQRSLYDYFKDAENLTSKDRYPIRIIVEDIMEQVKILAPDVIFDTSQIEYNLLPLASLVEWTSIFQNIFLNAFNAMLDSEKKLISIKTIFKGDQRMINIQDTGVGVDLENSDELFKPFVREMKTSLARKELQYGGSGLGLTIIRLIARNIGCSVSFVEPDPGFSTAFTVKWSEKNG